ncbi:GntR family transcriptional regulator [Actinopolyspora lacussalsi]|nr:GntR family transcriptional regulator [Actinopolyspora lacussalsi]
MGLDPADTRPAYRQVADQLSRRIASGELAPGDQLPSLSALTSEYGISAVTARAAIKELSNAGLVIVRQGQGAFVLEGAGSRTEASVDELAELIHRVNDAVEDLSSRVRALEARLPGDQPEGDAQARRRDR